MKMDMDERWLRREPEVMLATFHGYQDELFDLILDDVRALPPEPVILVEGFSLLPRLVAPLLPNREHAAWLTPTPRFRRAAFESRGSLWQIAGQTSDPPRALERLLRRDELFTDQVSSEAEALGLAVIRVDIGLTENELAERVAGLLSLTGLHDRV